MSDDPSGPPAAEPPSSGAPPSNVTRLERPARPPRGVAAQPFDAREQKARGMLGSEAPYVPLGFDGEHYWVIDRNQIVRGIRPDRLSRNMMVSVCGEPWLEARFPRTRKGARGKPQQVSGIAAEKAAAELMDVCSILGFWEPSDRVRGLGAWDGADGSLVLHRGSHLIVDGQVRSLGRLSGSEYVYVPRTPLAEVPNRQRHARAIDAAAAELRGRLDTFRWHRNTFDADLCLGWICAAVYGGALKWRTHLWVTGDFESGKTTLQRVVAAVFGAGIISVTDTTPAGLWQAIQQDACPIQVDELEPSNDPRGERQMQIVKLMRQASSGALVLRGGQAHAPQSFMVRSSFMCCSIILPPMPSQDVSRMIVLQLDKDERLPADKSGSDSHGFTPFVSIDRDLGGRLTRRMIDEWPRFRDEVMPAARLRMMEAGFSARLADDYAPVWAAADVAQHDKYDDARLVRWLGGGPARGILAAAVVDQTPEHERCIAYLLSSRLDQRRVESETFGDLIQRVAIGLSRAPMLARQADLLDTERLEIQGLQPKEAQAVHRLASFGIKVTRAIEGSTDGPMTRISVLIASTHRQLAEIFAPSIWRTLPEAANGGGWSQVLRRAPGAVQSPHALRLRGGVRSRVTILPIETVLGIGPDDLLRQPVIDDDEARLAMVPVH